VGGDPRGQPSQISYYFFLTSRAGYEIWQIAHVIVISDNRDNMKRLAKGIPVSDGISISF
jgi:hypothetical protein